MGLRQNKRQRVLMNMSGSVPGATMWPIDELETSVSVACEFDSDKNKCLNGFP